MTGWQRFERALAALSVAVGMVATVGWVVSVVQGDGLWAAVGLVLAVVEIAFAVVWFRGRVPYWAGLVLAGALAVPVAFAYVELEGAAARVGASCSLAVLVLAAVMYGRRYDQPAM